MSLSLSRRCVAVLSALWVLGPLFSGASALAADDSKLYSNGVALKVDIDANEIRTTPVAHRYIHGTILSDAKFQLLLPTNWNGKLAIFTRGFSGNEFSTGRFQTPALMKGYAFASSDEGWSRDTIVSSPEDRFYESRQRLVQLTRYAQDSIKAYYGFDASRTLLLGTSNGGHHTKWMIEEYPHLYDGGLAGFGYNGQIGEFGGMSAFMRNYEVFRTRINDIVAARAANPSWDPALQPLNPALTPEQLVALQNVYIIPATLRNGFTYSVGRPAGSEFMWASGYNTLRGYLSDVLPKLDPTFNPNGGDLTDDELSQWDPTKSPHWVQKELALLDLTGRITRPILVMQGTADPVVPMTEAIAYKALVEKVLGPAAANRLLAVYMIPGMGHGGQQYDSQVNAQIDTLEAWIDWHQSRGSMGSLPPAMIGPYPRTQ